MLQLSLLTRGSTSVKINIVKVPNSTDLKSGITVLEFLVEAALAQGNNKPLSILQVACDARCIEQIIIFSQVLL